MEKNIDKIQTVFKNKKIKGVLEVKITKIFFSWTILTGLSSKEWINIRFAVLVMPPVEVARQENAENKTKVNWLIEMLFSTIRT